MPVSRATVAKAVLAAVFGSSFIVLAKLPITTTAFFEGRSEFLGGRAHFGPSTRWALPGATVATDRPATDTTGGCVLALKGDATLEATRRGRGALDLVLRPGASDELVASGCSLGATPRIVPWLRIHVPPVSRTGEPTSIALLLDGIAQVGDKLDAEFTDRNQGILVNGTLQLLYRSPIGGGSFSGDNVLLARGDVVAFPPSGTSTVTYGAGARAVVHMDGGIGLGVAIRHPVDSVMITRGDGSTSVERPQLVARFLGDRVLQATYLVVSVLILIAGSLLPESWRTTR